MSSFFKQLPLVSTACIASMGWLTKGLGTESSAWARRASKGAASTERAVRKAFILRRITGF
ncbi:MAG: hypothetical protein EBX68_09540 [Betaproteobacteria bacterium]|nr:hypothetical protein [Betaproteobacteria bacterium]